MFFKETFHFFSLFILIMVSMAILISSSQASSQIINEQNCTILLPRLHIFKRHILTRPKRLIVFPPKAAVLISQAFTKAIIDGRPPGLSYSIEFDMYSPTPDTLEGWQPTLLNERLKYEKQQAEKEAAKTATPALDPSTPKPLNYNEPMSNFDDIKNHDSHEINYEQWSDIEDSDFNIPDHHFYFNDVGIDSPMISQRFYSPFKNITLKRANLKQKQYHDMSKLYSKHLWNLSKTKNSKSKLSERPSYLAEDIQNWPPFEEEVYESVNDVPVWKYHQAYRERRDLFQRMETVGKIFNFDMKSCIQRAMCELRSSLKAYGESLMDDIVRIIFTIPKKLSFDDDYSFDFSQHGDEPNCSKIFTKSCPYKVLDFITKTLGTIKTDDVKYAEI